MNEKTDDLSTIKDFLNQMASQNNRCTAAPYFYVIRERKKLLAPLENSVISFFYSPDVNKKFYDWEEVEKFINENSDDGYSIEDFLECGEQEISIEHGMFLTFTDAENHLKENYYHYDESAYIYIKHAWRTPGLKRFLKSLFNYFDVEKGNQSL
jgi:hypothetical protein